MKPIKFKLNGHSYTADLRDNGFLGYIHYELRDDQTGGRIAGGGISRMNYPSDKAHRAAIKKTCLAKAQEQQEEEATK